MNPKLLIVDDDEEIRTQMKWALAQDYEVLLAEDRVSAVECFKFDRPPVVLMDLGLPPQPNSPEEGLAAMSELVALDRLVKVHDLGSLAYYYSGAGNAENEDAISSIILGNSLLTARGIPVAGEYEIQNVQAMKIMDSFGAGGSFTEFYAMDFKDDVVLMGHDGPGHIGIAEGRTKVRPLRVFHGKTAGDSRWRCPSSRGR